VSRYEANERIKKIGLRAKEGAMILKRLRATLGKGAWWDRTTSKNSEKYAVLKALEDKLAMEVKKVAEILRIFDLNAHTNDLDTKTNDSFRDAAKNAVRDAIRSAARESEKYREECRQLLRERRMFTTREHDVLEHVASSLTEARSHCELLRSEMKSCQCGALLHPVETQDACCLAQLSNEEDEGEEEDVEVLRKKLNRARRQLSNVQRNLATWKTACERSSIGKLERRLENTQGQIYEWKAACSKARNALEISVQKSEHLKREIRELNSGREEHEALERIRAQNDDAIQRLRIDRNEFQTSSEAFREQVLLVLHDRMKRERDSFRNAQTEMSNKISQNEMYYKENLCKQQTTFQEEIEAAREHVFELKDLHETQSLNQSAVMEENMSRVQASYEAKLRGFEAAFEAEMTELHDVFQTESFELESDLSRKSHARMENLERNHMKQLKQVETHLEHVKRYEIEQLEEKLEVATRRYESEMDRAKCKEEDSIYEATRELSEEIRNVKDESERLRRTHRVNIKRLETRVETIESFSAKKAESLECRAVSSARFNRELQKTEADLRTHLIEEVSEIEQCKNFMVELRREIDEEKRRSEWAVLSFDKERESLKKKEIDAVSVASRHHRFELREERARYEREYDAMKHNARHEIESQVERTEHVTRELQDKIYSFQTECEIIENTNLDRERRLEARAQSSRLSELSKMASTEEHAAIETREALQVRKKLEETERELKHTQSKSQDLIVEHAAKRCSLEHELRESTMRREMFSKRFEFRLEDVARRCEIQMKECTQQCAQDVRSMKEQCKLETQIEMDLSNSYRDEEIRLASRLSRFERFEIEFEETQTRKFQDESDLLSLELRQATHVHGEHLERVEAEAFELRMTQLEEMELRVAKANHEVVEARHDLELQRVHTQEAASRHEARLEYFVATSREELSKRDAEYEASVVKSLRQEANALRDSAKRSLELKERFAMEERRELERRICLDREESKLAIMFRNSVEDMQTENRVFLRNHTEQMKAQICLTEELAVAACSRKLNIEHETRIEEQNAKHERRVLRLEEISRSEVESVERAFRYREREFVAKIENREETQRKNVLREESRRMEMLEQEMKNITTDRDRAIQDMKSEFEQHCKNREEIESSCAKRIMKREQEMEAQYASRKVTMQREAKVIMLRDRLRGFASLTKRTCLRAAFQKWSRYVCEIRQRDLTRLASALRKLRKTCETQDEIRSIRARACLRLQRAFCRVRLEQKRHVFRVLVRLMRLSKVMSRVVSRYRSSVLVFVWRKWNLSCKIRRTNRTMTLQILSRVFCSRRTARLRRGFAMLTQFAEYRTMRLSRARRVLRIAHIRVSFRRWHRVLVCAIRTELEKSNFEFEKIRQDVVKIKDRYESGARAMSRARSKVVAACLHRLARDSIASAFRVWYLSTRDSKLNKRMLGLNVLIRWYRTVSKLSKERFEIQALSRLESIYVTSQRRVAFLRWKCNEMRSLRKDLERASSSLNSLRGEILNTNRDSKLCGQRFRVMMFTRAFRLVRRNHLIQYFDRWTRMCRTLQRRDSNLSRLLIGYRRQILLRAWQSLRMHTQIWRSIEAREFLVQSTIEKIEHRFESLQSQAVHHNMELEEERNRVQILENKCARLERESKTYAESAKLALESQRSVFYDTVLGGDDVDRDEDVENVQHSHSEEEEDEMFLDVSILEKGQWLLSKQPSQDDDEGK